MRSRASFSRPLLVIREMEERGMIARARASLMESELKLMIQGGFTPAAIEKQMADVLDKYVPKDRQWQKFALQALKDVHLHSAEISDSYTERSGDPQQVRILIILAIVILVIACINYMNLATARSAKRAKEVGIRKVLGATVRHIVRLLAWQFSKPVILANLIAWPAAWWVMRDWLNGFDTRIDLGPTPFLLAGLLALAIAIGTIATHAIRVARAIPIHALRYE